VLHNTPEQSEEMVHLGSELIHEAHEALVEHERGMLGGDRVMWALEAIRPRALEVVKNVNGCGGCISLLMAGMFIASLERLADRVAVSNGPPRGDITWEDMLEGRHQ
jgi:hypothetical protein